MATKRQSFFFSIPHSPLPLLSDSILIAHVRRMRKAQTAKQQIADGLYKRISVINRSHIHRVGADGRNKHQLFNKSEKIRHLIVIEVTEVISGSSKRVRKSDRCGETQR